MSKWNKLMALSLSQINDNNKGSPGGMNFTSTFHFTGSTQTIISTCDGHKRISGRLTCCAYATLEVRCVSPVQRILTHYANEPSARLRFPRHRSPSGGEHHARGMCVSPAVELVLFIPATGSAAGFSGKSFLSRCAHPPPQVPCPPYPPSPLMLTERVPPGQGLQSQTCSFCLHVQMAAGRGPGLPFPILNVCACGQVIFASLLGRRLLWGLLCMSSVFIHKRSLACGADAGTPSFPVEARICRGCRLTVRAEEQADVPPSEGNV